MMTSSYRIIKSARRPLRDFPARVVAVKHQIHTNGLNHLQQFQVNVLYSGHHLGSGHHEPHYQTTSDWLENAFHEKAAGKPGRNYVAITPPIFLLARPLTEAVRSARVLYWPLRPL